MKYILAEELIPLQPKLTFQSHTLVSVIMPSKGQEYTAIFASLTDVTSPSVSFLKTMPCNTEDE